MIGTKLCSVTNLALSCSVGPPTTATIDLKSFNAVLHTSKVLPKKYEQER